MTIVEFADMLGMSTATVSRAFSGKGRISEKTRSLVHAKAAELGYRPNLQARMMVRGRTDTIAFFHEAPDKLDSDYYVNEVAFGISAAAAEAGKYLQTMTVPPNSATTPEMMLDVVLSRSVDGFLVSLLQPWAHDLIAAARMNEVPTIVLDNTRPGDEATVSIGEQIEGAARRVGAYLAGIGRRCPAMIRGIHDEGKVEGFRTGLGAAGEALRVHPGGKTFQSGYDAMVQLLEREPQLDCLFCANDVLAIGAIRAALDQGRAVPGDLAVIGCDDLAMARYMAPALTTIRLPKYDLGHWAVGRLLARIDNRPPPLAPNLECSLVLRQSA